MMGSRNKHCNELNSDGAEAGADESVSIREGGGRQGLVVC